MILGQGKQIRINGNYIGFLEGRNFIAERQLGKKFRLYNGWGMSKELLNELVDCVEKIIFNIKDKGKLCYTLEVVPKNWLERGIAYYNPALREDQFILSETSFDRRIIPSVKVVK